MTKDRPRETGKSPKRAAVPQGGKVESLVRAHGLPSLLGVPDEAWADRDPADSPHILQPWSYSSAELEAIRRAVPKSVAKHDAELLLAEASAAAQMFVGHMQVRASSKPNPRDEIERLKAKVEELRDAINDLSSQTKKHLLEYLRPVQAPGEKPFVADSLRYSLDRFVHENRDALEHPPKTHRGGPRTKAHVQWLVVVLWSAFTRANGYNERAHGFPAFRTACCGPLYSKGLEHRSDEAWETVLTNGKAALAVRKPRVKGYKGRAERLGLSDSPESSQVNQGDSKKPRF